MCMLRRVAKYKVETTLVLTIGPWWCEGSTRYWNYLEDYWPSAGGLSAVNAIGTQLRDPINLGTDPVEYGSLNQ